MREWRERNSEPSINRGHLHFTLHLLPSSSLSLFMHENRMIRRRRERWNENGNCGGSIPEWKKAGKGSKE